MSLVDFEDGITEHATLEERGNTMQLQHPIVDTFVTSSVELGSGQYVHALLCIVLPPPNLHLMPPKSEALADTYQRHTQRKRAEAVLHLATQERSR
jgi:hypothetical protein